ncbi:UNVERIFIED_CONTAM: Sulfite oxidase [Sesamum calycinum]|uniref:Sulfite oxidase n=1 Tax=Sesamum calycinum TaxID=2727403 RepID=A0AAW2IWG8_9LAMI
MTPSAFVRALSVILVLVLSQSMLRKSLSVKTGAKSIWWEYAKTCTYESSVKYYLGRIEQGRVEVSRDSLTCSAECPVLSSFTRRKMDLNSSYNHYAGINALETLNRDHGYPLRVIVPGVIGARSVKWLDSINIIADECQGFFMQKDYKMFPPSVDWDNINWSTRRPQMDFPVQCAICSLDDVNMVKPGKLPNAETWRPHFSDSESSDKWAWVLFEAEADIRQSTEIIAKAVDIAGNVQPENVEVIWNLRGILKHLMGIGFMFA